jgi:alpha-1,3-glucan synthase
MVFPTNDYDNSGSFTLSNGKYSFAHKAYGADLLRYSWNYGRNWTDWKAWEDTTVIDGGIFSDPSLFWPGDHIQVQCEWVPDDTKASILTQLQ